MRKALTIILVSLFSISSFHALAGTSDPVVNKRQHNQHQRIKQGVKSGELTKEEAQNVRGEQKQIRTEERAYKADGQLTSAERKDLRQDTKAASKHIYQDKHNTQQR